MHILDAMSTKLKRVVFATFNAVRVECETWSTTLLVLKFTGDDRKSSALRDKLQMLTHVKKERSFVLVVLFSMVRVCRRRYIQHFGELILLDTDRI